MTSDRNQSKTYGHRSNFRLLAATNNQARFFLLILVYQAIGRFSIRVKWELPLAACVEILCG